MNDENHLEELIKEISETYKEIISNSDQAIYIYLDDSHKICNEKFSSMLGYDSPQEWADITESFPETFVAGESQETLVDAFQKAITNYIGSKFNVTWKKKSGDTVDTDVILVPIAFEDHLLALHFVSKI